MALIFEPKLAWHYLLLRKWRCEANEAADEFAIHSMKKKTPCTLAKSHVRGHFQQRKTK